MRDVEFKAGHPGSKLCAEKNKGERGCKGGSQVSGVVTEECRASASPTGLEFR